MITTENSNLILENLKHIFPEAVIRTANEDDTNMKMALVVNEIDGAGIRVLSIMAQEYELKLKLKRSGTGISIHLN